MGVVNPFKVPSSALIQCSKNFRFNPNYVNIFIPKIMSYLPLADSSIRKFHGMTFVELSSGKVTYISTFILLVIIPTLVCHLIISSLLGLRFLNQTSHYDRVTTFTIQ